MRIVKKPEDRRQEILDSAEALFGSKGYEHTTINDILRANGIAKGTFYHYFASKEDVMDAIVLRSVEAGVQAAEAIAADPSLGVHEKVLRIMLAQQPSTPDRHQLIEELHRASNALLHQKSLSETVRQLTPVLTGVIEQGRQEGLFATPYPQEAIELLLVSAVTLFDDGIFQWEPQELARKIEAFIYGMERLLGASPGSFAYIAQLFAHAADGEAGETEEPHITKGENGRGEPEEMNGADGTDKPDETGKPGVAGGPDGTR